MTDTNLIERLCNAGYNPHVDVYALLPEAVSAIEALQGENERLKASELAEHNQRLIANNAYLARRHDEAVIERRIVEAERDALAAELERMKEQRDVHKRMRDLHFAEKCDLQAKLNAAPKALAPLTDEQAIEAMWKARSKWMGEAGIDTAGIQHDVPTLYAMLPYFRAGEAAHGIGGTP